MKMIKEKITKLLESKIFLGFLYGVGIFVLLLIAFYSGVNVGFHKASFGRAWGENYEKNFGMMGPRPNAPFRMENFPNAHGAVGKIIKIALPTLIVEDKDGTEKVILTTNETNLQNRKQPINLNELKINDFIVVIGTPNKDGQIEAKFIRIMPNPKLLENKN